jgi:predicted TIM-barrel fold metal-dependent hydrolase
MSLTDNVRIISADDHVQEPADLWTTRLPKALRERAPHLAKLPDGSDAWEVPGYPPRPFGIQVVAAAGGDIKQSRIAWADCPKGTYEPGARLTAMDQDGIHATVLFPNVSLLFFMRQIDPAPDLYAPLCRAYNDWLSEFCSTDTRRLGGVGLIPLWDVAEAVAEMQRVAKLPGMKGVLLPISPLKNDWNDLRYEPIWKSAAEIGLVVHFHAGKPRGMPLQGEMEKQNSGMQIFIQIGRISLMETFGYVLWSGVFARHPDLKVVSVEGDIGWLPYFIERGAKLMKRHQRWTGQEVGQPPGYYVGRNFFATFEEDRLGVQLRHITGIDALMWASDYPHSATTWPKSREAIEETFAGVPADEVRRIVSDNAARIYRFN